MIVDCSIVGGSTFGVRDVDSALWEAGWSIRDVFVSGVGLGFECVGEFSCDSILVSWFFTGLGSLKTSSCGGSKTTESSRSSSSSKNQNY